MTDKTYTIWAQDTYVIEIEAESLSEAVEFAQYETEDDDWTYVSTSVEAEEIEDVEDEEEEDEF